MYTQIFGDLKVMASAPIPSDQRWFSLACGNNSVTLNFGDFKTLRISSPGQWTNSVFFWRGGEDSEFALFLDALPPGYIVYQNEDVIVLYLRNNVAYGCLRMSMKIHKSGKVEINNRVSDKDLLKLDLLYTTYQKKPDLNACLNIYIDNPTNIDLKGVGYEAIEGRRRLRQLFLDPFKNQPSESGDRIEAMFNRSFKVERIYEIRQLFVKMFAYAATLPE